MVNLVSSAFILETTYLQWVSNNETQENWTNKAKSQSHYNIYSILLSYEVKGQVYIGEGVVPFGA